MDFETAKNAAPFITPFIGALIESRPKPKLAAYFKDNDSERELLEHSTSQKFEEYLSRAFEKQSLISTVVFQNQPQKLEELYVPLSVEKTSASENSQVIAIDSYPEDLIPEHNKVLLTDTAGMGKSTIMKFLFLCCVRENKGIPVFVELRQLSSQKSVLDVVCKDLDPIDQSINKDFVLKLIRRGDFVFFLDGYDEIPFAEREEVTRQLQDFISKANNNQFILTSRPESALASFSDFQEFMVQPLDLDEAFELIRKYGKGADVADQLIQEISLHIENIEEFLTNPLLVSLLYKAYSFKRIVPQKKHTFYRQVYDALFEDHDSTKPGAFKREKHSGLDIDDFDSVLRVLGFLTIKQGQVEYEKDQILEYINKARNHCPSLQFKGADFLRDLLTTVPLFISDGDYYRWNHKSIQEYFASQFICRDSKGKQAEILRAMVSTQKSQRFQNVLDLCYDIDYKTFRNTVVYDLINQFLEYYDSNYMDIDHKVIDESDISLRKMLCFGKEVVLCRSELASKYFAMKKNWFVALVDYMRSTGAIKGNTSSCSATGWSKEGVMLYSKQPQLEILSILRRKENPIVVLILEKQYKELEVKRSNGRVVKRKDIYKPDDVCSSGESCLVTDDPTSPLNQPQFFCKVNSLLTHDDPLALHPEECRKLQAEIRQDIATEQQTDSLTSLI